MSRSASRLTSGLSSTPRTTLKIAALAPIPNASVRTTVIARPLARASDRRAKRRSVIQLIVLVTGRLTPPAPFQTVVERPAAISTDPGGSALLLQVSILQPGGRRAHDLTESKSCGHFGVSWTGANESVHTFGRDCVGRVGGRAWRSPSRQIRCYLPPGVAGQLPATSRMFVTSNSGRATASRPIAFSVWLGAGAVADLVSPASASIRPVTSTRLPTTAFNFSSAISSSLYIACDAAPDVPTAPDAD